VTFAVVNVCTYIQNDVVQRNINAAVVCFHYTDNFAVKNNAVLVHSALESELLEKKVVHESRLKELWCDKVILYCILFAHNYDTSHTNY
jgi:hypothetical protein